MPVSASEVQRALKKVDSIKAAGPDNLDTFFLTLTAYFIAEPLSFISNHCLFSNETPKNVESSLCSSSANSQMSITVGQFQNSVSWQRCLQRLLAVNSWNLGILDSYHHLI